MVPRRVVSVCTEVGSAMLERTNELENDDSAASYIRVYRGYALYSELPLANQLFGINDDRLMQVIPQQVYPISLRAHLPTIPI